MLHIISAVTHLEPVFPVVPPVQPSSLAIKDVSTHGVISPPVGWENHGRLEKTPWFGFSWLFQRPSGRVRHLALHAWISSRKAWHLRAENLLRKECLFTKTNPILWFSMFAYKNKLLSLCFGRMSFSSTIQKTKVACSLRDPYEDRPYGLSDTCLRSNLSPTIQNSRLIHPYLATTALFLPSSRILTAHPWLSN